MSRTSMLMYGDLKVGDIVCIQETGARAEILKLPTRSFRDQSAASWRHQYITLEITDKDTPRIRFHFLGELSIPPEDS